MATPDRHVKMGTTATPEEQVWNPITKSWDEPQPQDQYYVQWAPTRRLQDVWHVDPLDGYIFPEGEGAKVDGVWYTIKNAIDLLMVKAGESERA